MNKIFALIISAFCVLLSALFVGCGTAKTTVPSYKEYEQGSTLQGKVIENSSFSLEWDDKYKRILLIEKEKNYVWSTTPSQALKETVDEYGYPKENHPQVNSAILVEYLNSESQTLIKVSSYISSVKKETVSVENIDNGIRATYYFPGEEFVVPVDYILKENCLSITVDSSLIKQGKHQLCRVIVAPFMCSIKNTQSDGYLFYPSGSGTLIYPRELEGTPLSCSQEVYGADAERYLPYKENTTNTRDIRMPVYGMKNGDNGLCAIIEEGAESASIETSVGSIGIGYSGVYAAFDIKGYQWVKSTEKYSKLYGENSVLKRFTVSFYPLNNENANYIGMANTYRDYLQKNKGLANKSQDSMLSMQILGGVYVQDSILGIPTKKIFANTTLNEALEIVSEIKNKTGEEFPVSLIGFGDSGLDIAKIAGNYSLNSNLGNKKQLKELADYCNKNSLPMYMNFDLLHFNKSNNAASTFTDKAVSSNGRVTTKFPYSVWARTRNDKGGKYYLVSREKLPSVSEKLIVAAHKLGLQGVGIDTLSNICYSDFKEVRTFVKGSMAEDVSKIIKSYKNEKLAVAVNNANDYAACLASQIYDAPLQSAEYDMFNETIPFYEIVFKGKVSLSSTPLNLSSDIKAQTLRAIESGCGFNFMVSKNYDPRLMDTQYSVFFGTTFEDVKSLIVSTVEQYGDYYKDIKNETIVDHLILENDVRKTVFSNGTIVYVNYSDEKQVLENIEIDAMSCKVLGGDSR